MLTLAGLTSAILAGLCEPAAILDEEMNTLTNRIITAVLLIEPGASAMTFVIPGV